MYRMAPLAEEGMVLMKMLRDVTANKNYSPLPASNSSEFVAYMSTFIALRPAWYFIRPTRTHNLIFVYADEPGAEAMIENYLLCNPGRIGDIGTEIQYSSDLRVIANTRYIQGYHVETRRQSRFINIGPRAS